MKEKKKSWKKIKIRDSNELTWLSEAMSKGIEGESPRTKEVAKGHEHGTNKRPQEYHPRKTRKN